MGVKTLRGRRARRSRGMAMVEMVFVLPLLLLVVFSIAQLGFMFSRWLTLSNAVREGAREAVMYRGASGCDPGKVEDQAKARVVAYANAGGVPIDARAVTVEGEGPCVEDGNSEVSATYNYPLNIPFAEAMMAEYPVIILRYTSTMRNEG